MTIFEIIKGKMELMKMFEEGDLNEQDYAVLMDEVMHLVESKGAGMVQVDRKFIAGINAIDDEIKRLQDLKSAAAGRHAKFHDMIMTAMHTLGTKKIETNFGNISLKTTIATSIDEMMDLPKEYIATKIVPAKEVKSGDKKKIKAAIQSGIKVPGASLVYNKKLTIK